MQNSTTRKSLFTTVLNKFHIVFQAGVFSQPLMKEYEDWKAPLSNLQKSKMHLSGYMKIHILAAVTNDNSGKEAAFNLKFQNSSETESVVQAYVRFFALYFD